MNSKKHGKAIKDAIKSAETWILLLKCAEKVDALDKGEFNNTKKEIIDALTRARQQIS